MANWCSDLRFILRCNFIHLTGHTNIYLPIKVGIHELRIDELEKKKHFEVAGILTLPYIILNWEVQ